MRIFDTNNIELTNPDLSRGYLNEDKIFVKHHEATQPIEERWHYEVIKVYPNGGKDIKKVVDVAGVSARDAWDEYEDIFRYIEYTEDEIREINDNQNRPTLEERIVAIEAAILEFVMGTAVNGTVFIDTNQIT